MPTTKESFKELFPPEFSNRKEATAIAKKTLRTLKKNLFGHFIIPLKFANIIDLTIGFIKFVAKTCQ